ncbi:MAG: hypothetical protein SGI92_04400 [Bryobacteraceae bacterium]|nr:hypothetical protein [Bryobacteraceae bacterium]
MANERDVLELCRGLCRPEREAVLMEVEQDDPELAERVRRTLEKQEPQR